MKAQISGIVFRDYNATGVLENTAMYYEPGFANVLVIAYNAANAEAGRATSDNTGAYSIPVAAGTYRLEFSNLIGQNYDGAGGASNGTSIQFVTAPATQVNFGVSNIFYHVDANPAIAVPCFVGSNQETGQYSNRDVLVAFQASAGGLTDATSRTPPPTALALAHQIGSTHGIAYQAASHTLFAAAYIKARTGLAQDTTGAIYWIHTETQQSGLLININDPTLGGAAGHFGLNAAGENPFKTHNFSSDSALVSAAVFRAAWGDIDISEDGTKLYAVNLYNRRIYTIPIPNPITTITSAAGITVSPVIPSVCEGTPRVYAVNTGFATGPMPFGLGVKDGKVYVGVRCKAGAGTPNWSVYAYNPNSNTFDADDKLGATGAIGSTATNSSGVIADLAFQEDTLILSIRHLSGDNYPGAESSGNILRACPDGDGTWTLEANGSVCGHATAGASGHATNEGPGTGEYYWGENAAGVNKAEGSIGTLVQLPGYRHVASTTFDAFGVYQLGVDWLDNWTGERNRHYKVANINVLDASTINGKNNALGDLEYVSDPAPIQIGNRVWSDTDNDGIQDATEPPIQNVTVELWADTNNDTIVDTKVGETTTDTKGNYLFGGTAKANMLSHSVTYNSYTHSAVGSTSDDAEQPYPTGITNPNSSHELNYNPASSIAQWVGLRFGGVTIPQGATITDARIAVVDGASATLLGTTGAFSLTVKGQNINSAALFSSTNNNISNRAMTTASATWSIANAWPNAVDQTSPNLSAIVQEIVNRADWDNDDAMAFLLEPNGSTEYRVIVPFSSNPAMVPTLNVTYTATKTEPYCVEPNTRYEVRIPNAAGGSQQAALNHSALTLTDAGNKDAIDSDGTLSGNTALKSLTTGGYGQNDHSYDFGFKPACAITVSSATPTVCNPATNTYTLDVVVAYTSPPAGNIRINIEGTSFTVTPDGTSPDTYTIAGLSSNGVQNMDVSAHFVSDATCSHTLANAYNAPMNCQTVCCAATLIQNGSFETGSWTGTDGFAGATHNATVMPDGATMPNNWSTDGGFWVENATKATQGARMIWLKPEPSVYTRCAGQDFTTVPSNGISAVGTLVKGKKYKICFDYAAFDQTDPNNTAPGVSNLVVELGPQVLFTIPMNTVAWSGLPAGWQHFSNEITVPANATNPLRVLLSTNPTGKGMLFDNVSLCEVVACDTTLVVQNATICNGSTVNLYAQASGVKGTLTYSTNGTMWSALTNPTNVTPSVSTTYYIKDALSGGCFDIDTMVITVNANPTVPTLASPINNPCPTTSVHLTTRAATLTPSIVGGVFEWHTANTSSSSLVATPTAVGNGTYYLFEKSPDNCYSTGTAVTVSIQTCCPATLCLPATVTRNN